MFVDKLNIARGLLEDHNKEVNIGKLLLTLNVNFRDLYYYGEAHYIIDNFEYYYGPYNTELLDRILVKLKDEKFKERIVNIVVEKSRHYNSRVHHDDFINDVVDTVVYHYNE